MTKTTTEDGEDFQTFVGTPAEDLRLVLRTDIEDMICIFCDGHVGGAWWDAGSRFVAGIIFETPQMDTGRSC